MKILTIDSQVLTSLSHCPLKAKYGFVDRLVSKEENPYFAMGSTVHVSFEDYYLKMKQGLTFKEKYDSAMITALNYMTTKTELTQERREIVTSTLDQYYKYRRDDRIKVESVEAPFIKLLYDGLDLKGERIQVFYQGKIDLIGETDTVEVWDHKTTSKTTPVVDLRPQFIGYSWYREARVIVNRVGFQKTLAPNQKFVRFPFQYRPEVIETWKQFAIGEALKYSFYLEENRWPPNFGACEGSHGYPCNFANLCRYPSLLAETIAHEFNVGEVWDVFAEKNT